MKTLKLTLMIVVAVFAAKMVSASGNLKVKISGMEEDKSFLHVSDVDLKQFEIILKDNDGNIVYYKRTKLPSTSYVSAYNFSQLRNGYYTLTVKTDKEMIESRMMATDGEVNIVKEQRIIQPHFSFTENLLRLSYLNYTGEEMAVHLFNGEDLIFTKDLGKDFSLTKGLDLSQLNTGDYRVVFTNGDQIFEYALAK